MGGVPDTEELLGADEFVRRAPRKYLEAIRHWDIEGVYQGLMHKLGDC